MKFTTTDLSHKDYKKSADILTLLEKALFYAIVLSIPLNLGKHFIVESSYIYGKLIDYVIPTIYIQDILIFLLVTITFPKLLRSAISALRHWEIALIVLFFASVILSVCSAKFPVASRTSFIRLALYSLFAFYTFSQINFLQEMPKLLKIFAITLFFQAVLGIAQWINQGSVFNNYLFFGEQPYSVATPQIVRTPWKGFTRVPPYGTFRHPNVLAAFLVFGILFIIGMSPAQMKYYIPLPFATLCLFLTFSSFSLYTLIFGLIALLLPKKYFGNYLSLIFWLGIFATLFLVFVPSMYLPDFLQEPIKTLFSDPSLFRRRNLLLVGFQTFKTSPLFGVGLNNSLYFVDKLSVALSLPKFTQPIHNIYLLLLSETGLIALSLLCAFFILLFIKMFQHFQNPFSGKYPRLLLTLLTTAFFLGFFDHYLITAHQILLLSCLTVGLALQYNLK